jgi:hypothetical protein
MIRLFAVIWLTPLYLFLRCLDSVVRLSQVGASEPSHPERPKLQLVHGKKLPAVHRSSS